MWKWIQIDQYLVWAPFDWITAVICLASVLNRGFEQGLLKKSKKMLKKVYKKFPHGHYWNNKIVSINFVGRNGMKNFARRQQKN